MSKWEKKKKKDARDWDGMSHFGCVPSFKWCYDLKKPAAVYSLPSGKGALSEISGLCFDQQSGYFFLIEDEHPILTAWSEERQQIVWQEDSLDGEFEDVAVISDGSVYMLKTNGNLVVRSPSEEWKQIKVPQLDKVGLFSCLSLFLLTIHKSDNCEGLCYWKQNGLVIAPKAERLDEDEKRFYLLPDMQDGKSLRLLFVVPLAEISRVLGSSIDTFNPSGLAIHPITGHIYIIATSGQLLIVVDQNEFRVLAAVHLPRDPFVQPEGITFRPDGTLYISNEGRTKEGGPGVGTILKFQMIN